MQEIKRKEKENKRHIEPGGIGPELRVYVEL